MKKLETKFERMAKGVKLTDAEKTRMREYLLQYQSWNPISPSRMNLRSAERPQGIRLGYFIFSKPVSAITVLAIFLISSVGVSAAAENTVPGDLLYPVKVSVNEKLQGAFAISAPARASFKTALADRRLSEAEALAVEGALSTNTETDLKTKFIQNIEEATAEINQVRGTDFTEADVEETKLTAVLAAHADILAGVSGDDIERDNLISAIRSEADLHANAQVNGIAAAALRTQGKGATIATSHQSGFLSATSDEISTNTSESVALPQVRAMKHAALEAYSEATEVLFAVSRKLSANTNLEAQASLAQAKDLIISADTLAAANTDQSLQDAFDRYRAALAIEAELTLRLQSNASLNLPLDVLPSVIGKLIGNGASRNWNTPSARPFFKEDTDTSSSQHSLDGIQEDSSSSSGASGENHGHIEKGTQRGSLNMDNNAKESGASLIGAGSMDLTL